MFKISAWMGHSTSEVAELYAHLTAYDDDIGRLNSPAAAERLPVVDAAKPGSKQVRVAPVGLHGLLSFYVERGNPR